MVLVWTLIYLAWPKDNIGNISEMILLSSFHNIGAKFRTKYKQQGTWFTTDGIWSANLFNDTIISWSYSCINVPAVSSRAFHASSEKEKSHLNGAGHTNLGAFMYISLQNYLSIHLPMWPTISLLQRNSIMKSIIGYWTQYSNITRIY